MRVRCMLAFYDADCAAPHQSRATSQLLGCRFRRYVHDIFMYEHAAGNGNIIVKCARRMHASSSLSILYDAI